LVGSKIGRDVLSALAELLVKSVAVCTYRQHHINLFIATSVLLCISVTITKQLTCHNHDSLSLSYWPNAKSMCWSLPSTS